FTYDVAGTRAGELDTDLALEPTRHYDVYTSVTSITVDGAGLPSASDLTELDPVGQMHVMQQSIFGALKRALFDVIQFFNGLMRRLRAKRGER
ncbi:MAG TPA: hypothetical protein VF752_06900, partial [Thermoleophilaceae bacterium]